MAEEKEDRGTHTTNLSFLDLGDEKLYRARLGNMLGRDHRDIRVRVGGHNNCNIHTHVRSQRVADG